MQVLVHNAGIKISSITIKDYEAIAAKDRSGSFAVEIFLTNKCDDYCERNFLIAHLLGHFFLHIQPFLLRGEWKNTGFKEQFRPLLRYQQDSYTLLEDQARLWELEADWFAAAILLPKSLVLRAEKKLSKIEAVAKFFDVPTLFLQRRLSTLHETSRQPQSFMEAENFSQSGDNKENIAAQSTSGSEGIDIIRRANLTIGQSSYQKTLVSSNTQQKDKQKLTVPQEKNPLEQSLKRFRQLANRLDSSVDVN